MHGLIPRHRGAGLTAAHERGLEAVIAIHIFAAKASSVAHPVLIDIVVDARPQALNLVLIHIYPDIAAIAAAGADALDGL